LPEKATTARVESMSHAPVRGLAAVRAGRVRVPVIMAMRVPKGPFGYDRAGSVIRVWLAPTPGRVVAPGGRKDP
jgi:hypothetical protein